MLFSEDRFPAWNTWSVSWTGLHGVVAACVIAGWSLAVFQLVVILGSIDEDRIGEFFINCLAMAFLVEVVAILLHLVSIRPDPFEYTFFAVSGVIAFVAATVAMCIGMLWFAIAFTALTVFLTEGPSRARWFCYAFAAAMITIRQYDRDFGADQLTAVKFVANYLIAYPAGVFPKWVYNVIATELPIP